LVSLFILVFFLWKIVKTREGNKNNLKFCRNIRRRFIYKSKNKLMYLKQNTYQYSSFAFMITLRSLMWRKYLKKTSNLCVSKNNTRNVQTKSIYLNFIFHVYNKRFYPTAYSHNIERVSLDCTKQYCFGKILGKGQSNSKSISQFYLE
jgi:hypothetical protein